mgnify:FL=1
MVVLLPVTYQKQVLRQGKRLQPVVEAVKQCNIVIYTNSNIAYLSFFPKIEKCT